MDTDIVVGRRRQVLTDEVRADGQLTVAAVDVRLAYGITCSNAVKSTDAGATWSALSGSQLTNYDPHAIAVGPDGKQAYCR